MQTATREPSTEDRQVERARKALITVYRQLFHNGYRKEGEPIRLYPEDVVDQPAPIVKQAARSLEGTSIGDEDYVFQNRSDGRLWLRNPHKPIRRRRRHHPLACPAFTGLGDYHTGLI